MKIAQVLISDSWGEISPDLIEKGLGGRETAMISLAREWAKQGHEVTNFVNVEKSSRFEEKPEFSPIAQPHIAKVNWDEIELFGRNGYHEYVPINIVSQTLANFPYDVCVAWECPSVFNKEAVRENIKVKICEMQVAHLHQREMEATQHCDHIAVLSEWAGGFLTHQGLEDPSKIVVLPNGIDAARYQSVTLPKKLLDKSAPHHFIYSSSPDRGLWPLLKMWPDIRQILPDAQLDIAYGVEKLMNHLKWMHAKQGEMALEILELMNQPGVRDLGKIGQRELSEFQINATGFLYPCDPLAPTETGCITVVENAAAGNPMVISDADCLQEEFKDFAAIVQLPFDKDQWLEVIQTVYTEPDIYEDLSQSGLDFAKTRYWEGIAKQWTNLFTDSLHS